MSIALSRKIINCISIVGIIATIAVTIYFIRLGVFKDVDALRGLVGDSVILGPILFMLIQIIQVVIPIIPGGISCAAGVLIFGRQYGKPFILSLVSDKTYNKYIGWLDNEKRFERLFALAIFLPIAPDDALCLMAGLTKMSLKKFTLIIILAKPVSIFLYSLALIYGGTFLNGLLGF